MKIPGLVAISLIMFALTGLSYADPDRPGRIHVKIRMEYRGLAAPDHLMFAMHVRSMKGTAEFNRDIALDMVQQHMQLGSEEAAEAFLPRLIATVDELDSERGKVFP